MDMDTGGAGADDSGNGAGAGDNLRNETRPTQQQTKSQSRLPDTIDQELLSQFSSMNTTDRDVLISQFRQFLADNHISTEACAFYLEMNNWNLGEAIGSYFDYGENSLNRHLGMTVLNTGNRPEELFVTPNSKFDCSWLIKNSGTESWPVGSCLQCMQGTRLCQTDRIFVNPCEPGASTNVHISMTSPAECNTFQSQWRLASPTGFLFGDVIWVIVTVRTEDASITDVTDQLINLAPELSPSKLQQQQAHSSTSGGGHGDVQNLATFNSNSHSRFADDSAFVSHLMKSPNFGSSNVFNGVASGCPGGATGGGGGGGSTTGGAVQDLTSNLNFLNPENGSNHFPTSSTQYSSTFSVAGASSNPFTCSTSMSSPFASTSVTSASGYIMCPGPGRTFSGASNSATIASGGSDYLGCNNFALPVVPNSTPTDTSPAKEQLTSQSPPAFIYLNGDSITHRRSESNLFSASAMSSAQAVDHNRQCNGTGSMSDGDHSNHSLPTFVGSISASSADSAKLPPNPSSSKFFQDDMMM